MQGGVELIGHVEDVTKFQHGVPDTPVIVDILAVDEASVVNMLR